MVITRVSVMEGEGSGSDFFYQYVPAEEMASLPTRQGSRCGGTLHLINEVRAPRLMGKRRSLLTL